MHRPDRANAELFERTLSNRLGASGISGSLVFLDFSIRHGVDRIDDKPCRSAARKPSQEYAEQKTKRAFTLVKINRGKTADEPARAVNDPVQKRKSKSSKDQHYTRYAARNCSCKFHCRNDPRFSSFPHSRNSQVHSTIVSWPTSTALMDRKLCTQFGRSSARAPGPSMISSNARESISVRRIRISMRIH